MSDSKLLVLRSGKLINVGEIVTIRPHGRSTGADDAWLIAFTSENVAGATKGGTIRCGTMLISESEYNELIEGIRKQEWASFTSIK